MIQFNNIDLRSAANKTQMEKLSCLRLRETTKVPEGYYDIS